MIAEIALSYVIIGVVISAVCIFLFARSGELKGESLDEVLKVTGMLTFLWPIIVLWFVGEALYDRQKAKEVEQAKDT